MSVDSGGSKNQANPPGTVERRRHGRLAVLDGVVFSDEARERPPKEGVLTERSASDLRIETRHPEPVGTVVEVEVKIGTGPQAEVLFLEGVVVHVTPLNRGLSAMGLRLRTTLGKGTGLQGSFEPVRVLEVNLPDALLPRPDESDEIDVRVEEAPSSREIVSFRRIHEAKAATHRSKWTLAIILLIILIIFFLTVMQVRKLIIDARGPSAFATMGGIESEEPVPRQGADSARGAASEDMDQTAAVRVPEAPLARAAGPETLLSLAEAALDAGQPLEAGKLFDQLQSRSDTTSTQRFIALLGHSQAAELRGEHGLALEFLRRAYALRGEVPDVWSREASALGDLLAGGDVTPSRFAAMDQLLDIGDAAGGDADAPPIRVEVDTGDYVLSVIRDGQVVAQFPVGLGWDGSTPEGEFSIVNKISDPDWYNRGEVVLAGDPDNPLGGQWMGLGEEEVATSYGIHPSNDPRAIGQPFSRGCVRMRPTDAETLFRLVPVGTPVTIHS